MAFQNIPKPFNENDVRAWLGRILRDLCRESRPCVYPSEFILDEEMRGARAYDNLAARERAISDEDQDYYKMSKYCLNQLVIRQVLRTDIWLDPSDNRQYTVYCKTDLLDALCPSIIRYQLPDIDRILEEHREGRI